VLIGADLPVERLGQRRGGGKRIQRFSSRAGIDPGAIPFADCARGTARIGKRLEVLVPQLIEFSCCRHFARHIR